jgi:acyl carrier protein
LTFPRCGAVAHESGRYRVRPPAEGPMSGPDPALRRRLLEFLATLTVDLGDDVNDDTALVGSGRLDSLALVQLVLWVEEEIGQPVDPGVIDMTIEWTTVRNLLVCIERNRRA